MKKLTRRTVTETEPSTNRLITLDGNIFLDRLRIACIGDDHEEIEENLKNILFSLRGLLWVEPGDVESHLCDNNMVYIQKVEDLVFAEDD
jgi:hypothetical protein